MQGWANDNAGKLRVIGLGGIITVYIVAPNIADQISRQFTLRNLKMSEEAAKFSGFG